MSRRSGRDTSPPSLIDEAGVEEAIRQLPTDVRNHLSHIVRHGICLTLSASRCNGSVEKALFEFEDQVKRIGL